MKKSFFIAIFFAALVVLSGCSKVSFVQKLYLNEAEGRIQYTYIYEYQADRDYGDVQIYIKTQTSEYTLLPSSSIVYLYSNQSTLRALAKGDKIRFAVSDYGKEANIKIIGYYHEGSQLKEKVYETTIKA